MSSSPAGPVDLLDLKLVPAWVKEPGDPGAYAHYKGEEEPERSGDRNRARGGRDRPTGRSEPGRNKPGNRRGSGPREPRRVPAERPPVQAPEVALDISIRFTPQPPVLQSVVSQIQSDHCAYSLFFLARLFLEKPQRYDVTLQAKDGAPLHQTGEDGPVSVDRSFLETNAFRFAGEKFYNIAVTQSEPLKGNFSTVARCRLSGNVLGPTNHHGYQPRLRSLYEQRFSRRMSFAEYQRQIEIVNDPAVVEQWKEEARNVTTFTTLHSDPPETFNNAADAERHFRQHHLSGLVRVAREVTLSGVDSRQLGDRRLHRHIEQAWSNESRSPTTMMQELSRSFRETALHIFRHRRGMLFVSAIRPRTLVREGNNLSFQVKTILETIVAVPRIHRKDLAEKLFAEKSEDDPETRKLSLAADLRWLINEGYVIEFNDGSLDLPRVKAKPPEKNRVKVADPVPSDAEPIEAPGAGAPAANDGVATSEEKIISPPESRPDADQSVGEDRPEPVN